MKIKPIAVATSALGQATVDTVKLLERAQAGVDVPGLKEHFSALFDAEELSKGEIVNAAVAALAQLLEPQAVIDSVVGDVAAALKKRPEEIREKLKVSVAAGLAALGTRAVVSDAVFDAHMAPVDARMTVPSAEKNRTARPFGQMRNMPADEYKNVVKQLAEEIKATWDNNAPNAPVVDYFVKRFEEITGIHVVRADTVAALLRDFGDAFRSLFEREMPITIIAGPGETDQQAVRVLMTGVYDELKARGLQERVSHVGRFGAGGAQQAAFGVLDAVKSVDRIAVAAPTKATLTGAASVVDKPVLFGQSLGDETWLMREFARRGFAIVLGGDAASTTDAKAALARNPGRTVVCGGFCDNAELNGVKDAQYLPDAMSQPAAAGRKIGTMIADAIEREQRDLLADPLMQAVFKGSTGQLSDMVTALQQNAAQNRIVRIITAVGERMERAGVPSQQIWQEVSTLSQELARYTIGVDNFKDNALWQKRAKEAFAATGGKVAEFIDDATIDVYFASWGGIQRKAEEPSYFEAQTSALPSLGWFDFDAPHTMLDLGKYCYKRMDKPISDMLQRATAGDPAMAPEVFLGSEQEMKAFYAAKGFSTSYNTFDSNGTYYLVFQRGDVVKPVIFGIDSPARLTQVTALLAHGKVDTSKIVVRGAMDRVRLKARNELEQGLAALGKGVAGVVINNTNEAIAALAASAGVDAAAVSNSATTTIGPFKFDTIEVQAVGRAAPEVILCFKPAYGELTQDLVNACLAVGARNFLIGGAAGSFINEDKEFGAMHRVTHVAYAGKHVDLAAAGLTLMKPIAGVTQDGVTNVFHPSPVLQDQAFATAQRKQFPKADVDQETGAALFALAEAKRVRGADEPLMPGDVVVDGEIFVSSLLHQSDIVGRGFLELGTIDKQYGANVKANVTAWAKQLGLKNVAGHAVAGARAGVLAAQKPSAVARVKVELADLSTIGTSNEFSHIDQFKGQKRCIVVDTKDATREDMELLKRTLSELDASQYWIVTAQNDSQHGEVLKLAEHMRFETLLATTRAAAQADAILGTPTFTMFFDDDDAIAHGKTELSSSGTRYEWEENSAQHFRIYAGDYAKPDAPQTNAIYTRGFMSESDASDAGESIRSDVKNARKRVEEGLAGWAKGTMVARAGDTLVSLAARYGLVDLRAGLNNALMPHVRALATHAGVDGADALDATQLKAALTPLRDGDGAARLALLALEAQGAWAENAGADDKVRLMLAAALAVATQADDATKAGCAPQLARGLADAARAVHKHGVKSALSTLNPTLGDNVGIEGESVRLRDGPARAAPHVLSSSFARAALNGRKPLYLTGASAKAWPYLSAEDRAVTVKQYRLLARLLDKDKTSVWTGLTRFGADKYVQEIFGPAGFQLMCVGTENTLKDLKDTSSHATHVLLVGINWFGKSREVAKLVEDLGGDMVVSGGGAIMQGEINQAVALGVRLHLQDGIKPSELGAAEAARLTKANKPVQLFASTEQAHRFKAHAFSATAELLDRLGIDRRELTVDDLSANVSAELIREVLDVSKEAAAMARYAATP